MGAENFFTADAAAANPAVVDPALARQSGVLTGDLATPTPPPTMPTADPALAQIDPTAVPGPPPALPGQSTMATPEVQPGDGWAIDPDRLRAFSDAVTRARSYLDAVQMKVDRMQGAELTPQLGTSPVGQQLAKKFDDRLNSTDGLRAMLEEAMARMQKFVASAEAAARTYEEMDEEEKQTFDGILPDTGGILNDGSDGLLPGASGDTGHDYGGHYGDPNDGYEDHYDPGYQHDHGSDHGGPSDHGDGGPGSDHDHGGPGDGGPGSGDGPGNGADHGGHDHGGPGDGEPGPDEGYGDGGSDHGGPDGGYGDGASDHGGHDPDGGYGDGGSDHGGPGSDSGGYGDG